MSDNKNDDNGQHELPSEATFPTLDSKADYPIMGSEDRLRAENLQLKLMNMALQEKDIRAKLDSVQTAVGSLQRQYLELQRELGRKYGVDLITSQVRSSDGAIVPRPQPPLSNSPSSKS